MTPIQDGGSREEKKRNLAFHFSLKIKSKERYKN
jgi:hypothetical protein